MWPRRQRDAAEAPPLPNGPHPPASAPLAQRSGVLGRPMGAPPPRTKAPLSMPKPSTWARREPSSASVDASSASKKAVDTAPSIIKVVDGGGSGDDAAWLLRAVEKKKMAKKMAKKKTKAEAAKDTPVSGVKRPRSAGARGKDSKQSKIAVTTAQSWKQRRQQWSANAKRADAAAVSEEERARAEQQQQGFDLVFQEVFGPQKPRQSQASGATAAGDRAVTSRVLESSSDDDEEMEQRGLALPVLDALAPTPSAPCASKPDREAESEDGGDEGDDDDSWTFSSASTLRLDDFDAKDGGDEARRGGGGGGVGSAAGRAALARWKEEDASHTVSDNFVRLHMRKRFKGRSGKAKKLPAYLRARGERLDDLAEGGGSASRKPNDQQALAGNGASSGGLLNDGLDFIDECLQLLDKVEYERAGKDAGGADAGPEAVSETPKEKAEEEKETADPPPPRCHHALACQQLAVKKKNQNHGRAFFACPLGFGEGRCDFFLWRDNHVALALRQLFARPEDATDGAKGSDDRDFVPLDASKPVEAQQETLLTNLRLVFGHARFRPGQEWAITRVLSRRDSLLVLPTGAGKSLCYQLPALLLPGVTLVVSPLVSLMHDQFERLPPALKARAACLTSSSSSSESSKAAYAAFVRDLLGGRLKLVLLSPERALSRGMQRLLAAVAPRLALVCVDEAHCVSEWSHHFRPSYLRLARVFRYAPCVLAMTATASRRVADDILAQLQRHQRERRQLERRASCSFNPVAPEDGEEEEEEEGSESMLLQLPWQRSNLQLRVRSVTTDEERTARLIRFLSTDSSTSKRSNGGVIVYVHQQRQTEELARVLGEQLPRLRIGAYHAKMDAARKESVRVGFLRGQLRVVVATVAFGMGIDKQNVRGVVHFHLPASAENYLQQVGRAGRDGKPARALLLLAPMDARLFRSLAFSNALTASQLHQLVRLALLAVQEEAHDRQDVLRGAEEHAVTVQRRASGGGERHWRTLSVEWAERALDMKEASIETFLTLLAQRLPVRPTGRAAKEPAKSLAELSLLPSGAARCRVRLADKQLRDLPAESLVRRLVRVADARQVPHASVEREVNGYLSSVTVSFHVGEMALALVGPSDLHGFLEDVENDENDLAARAQRQLLQTLRQAQLDGLVQRVTLDTRAFHVRVRFPAGVTAAAKRALAADVARELAAQHERMEARQLARLARLYAALSAAAVPVAAQIGDDEEQEKAAALEDKLTRYFQDDEGDAGDEAADLELLGEVLEPLTASMVEPIERDARALAALTARDAAGEQDESTGDTLEEDAPLPWTGLSVARVFHGLGSPAFPVRRWREHPLWRKYDAVAFEKLARIAERVLQTDREHRGGLGAEAGAVEGMHYQ